MKKAAPKKSGSSRLKIFFKVVSVFFGIVCLALLTGYFLFLYYRPEIKKAINARLSEEVNGEIEIGAVGIELFSNFPTLAITLENTHLRGPQHNRFPQDFFVADRVEMQLDAEKLVDKELHVKAIRISNAKCFVFRTKTGYTNLDIFKKQNRDSAQKTSPVVVRFRNIDVDNMSVLYYDSVQNKTFDFQFIKTENFILKRDSSLLFHVLGGIFFNGLTFNAEKGSFLTKKTTQADFHLEYFLFRKELVVSPSVLAWGPTSIGLAGKFRFADQKKFQLSITSDAVAYKDGLAVLSQAIQKKMEKFNVEKPIRIGVNIEGSMGEGKKPAVDVRYFFAKSKVTTERFDLNNATLTGSFSNHQNPALIFNDQNSMLIFDSLNASLNGIPFGAKAVIHNLTNPELDLKAKANFKLTVLNHELDKDEVQFTTGQAEANISYTGKLKSLGRDVSKMTGKLKGDVKVHSGGVRFVDEQLTVDQVSASVRFTQDRLDIDKLTYRINQNPMEATGYLVGFMPFLESPEKKGKVVLKVNSSRMDLTRMLARRTKSKTKTKRERRRQLMKTMNGIYDSLEFDVAFTVKDFIYNRFVGKNMKGNVVLAKDKLKANKMSVEFAAGKILFNLNVDRVLTARSPFSIRASMINSGIKEFFYAFNNFNQSAIKYQNLQGKLTMDATFQGMLDKELVLVPSTLLGRTTFYVRNGKLKDFEPLMNMSNFLFKRRDFSDVKFAAIKGDLKVRGTEIDVSRMEIQSSVLTAFVEGRYSLKDSTDLSIQLPLSNLKKRDKNYKPKNVGTDARVGPSVFLRAQTENGKTEISYDPLKKFRRKKAK